MHVTICHAGNGLEAYKETGNISEKTGKMNTKKLYMSLDTMPAETYEEFNKLHRNLKAFKSSGIYSMGTKAIYGPEGTGDLAVSYQGMIELLQVMHSGALWSCDMQKVLEEMQKIKQPAWKTVDNSMEIANIKIRSIAELWHQPC